MKRDNTCGFNRYSKTFEPIIERCTCGGCYNTVDLQKSDGKSLTLLCSNDTCPSVTLAHRKKTGLAFVGADRPLAII